MRSLAFVFVAAAACSPYSPDLGKTPFLCGSGTPKCPDGYTCVDNGMGTQVCASGGKVPDGPPPNSGCADDSSLEGPSKNDTIATAYQSPVATSRGSISFAGLAICPAGDKDTYSVTLTKTQNLEVIVDYDMGKAVLSGGILNGSGTAIVPLSPKPNVTDEIYAFGANLPAGIYYVQVQGPASGTMLTNNYKMTINVTPYP